MKQIYYETLFGALVPVKLVSKYMTTNTPLPRLMITVEVTGLYEGLAGYDKGDQFDTPLMHLVRKAHYLGGHQYVSQVPIEEIDQKLHDPIASTC